MKFDFNSNNDWIIICGNNGSGKTTLARFLLKKVPKERLVVINGGMERDWSLSAEKQNILAPPTYEIKWLNRKMLEIVIDPKYAGMMMVIDDADNWDIKSSEVLKGLFINQRRLNLGGLIITRRLSWIPIPVYDKAKYCFFSRQNSDMNIWYIMNLLGRETASKLKSLKPYEFLAYENSSNIHEIIKAPRM